MAERKNPELDAKHQAILRRMMQLQENKSCADCFAPYPRWASTNLGIFICMACSGIHRKLGTHISQVRSVTLDTWTPGQIIRFQKLGNAKAAAYFEACLPSDFKRPNASDTNRMEAFIRDKYERRRYITVENGGLGGADTGPRSNSSGLSSSSSRSSSRAKFSSSSRAAYDVDHHSSSRPTSSSSYAARFSSSSNSATNSGSQIRSNALNGTRPANPAAPTSAPDALKRASTLRELVNMGFSTDIALRAVQASQGDLQRAVDWVLANSDSSANPTASAAPNSATSNAPPPSAGVSNLLDFGDVPAPPASQVLPANGAAPVAKPAPTGVQAAKNPAASPAHFADFADFGDFESALPKKKPATPQQTKPVSASPAGLNSLAELYRKGPAKPSSPGRPMASQNRSPTTQLGTTTATSTTTTSTISPSSRPLSTLRQGKNAKPISPLSPIPRTGASPSRVADSATLGMPVINIKRDPAAVAASASKARSLKPNVISSSATQPLQRSPPPPPPMQERVIVSENAPPPPTSPPPKTNGTVEDSASTPLEPPPEENSSSKEEEKEKVEETNEDEDPFAALSMMALSSAVKECKVSKPKVPEPVAEDKPVVVPSQPIASTTPSVQSAGINLDDFFG